MTSIQIDDKNEDNSLVRNIEDERTQPPPLLFSKRFLVVFLLFIGCINMYALRGNLSIAVVEMTSNKTIIIENQPIYKPPEYNWDSPTIGFIISMFAYGYLFSIIGGNVSTKFGGSVTYGVTMFIVGFLTILTPLNLYTHFYLFLAGRVLAGIFESFAYSSTLEVLSRWTPLRERSSLTAYSFSGIYIGTACTYPFCGFIAHKWGWPMVFYVTGVIGCISAFIWLILVKNQPSKDKWISERELKYLLQETENTSRKEIIQPWRSILTSSCFWALCAGKFTYSVGFNILVTCFPLYVKDMTGRDTDEIGLISAIPNFVCIFMIPIAGKFIDYCQNHSNMNITKIHKILMSIGFLVGSFLFIVVVFITDFVISMACFVGIKVLLSFNFLVLQLVAISIAPRHSSTIAGLTAVWYTASTILTPTVVGYIVVTHSIEEWNKCFIISSVVLAVGAFIFIVFGSSEPQPWSTSSNYPQNKEYDLCIQNEKHLKQ